ncbi:unnamed protein product, partial [Mesorhabditis belari]|uniref:Neurotransmitter-gated ion-channel transmembrane domain-containing protein n=1 Tax=Mesorhabditis belari TaxID=2138241 RepID=A0AAF3EE13_9BILA
MQKLLPEEFSRLTKEMTTWGNGEWDVTNITTINVNQGGSEYIGYVLSIRRVPNFYVYVIALPCFILTALSVVGMFWTPNIKKEQLVKLTIGLTSLVSMTVLLDMLSDAIPKTSVFPLLGIYVVVCVGITSISSVIITLHCLPNPKMKEEKLPTKCKLSEPVVKPDLLLKLNETI